MTVKYGLKLSGVVRVFRKDKEIKGNGKKTFEITDVWYNVSEKEESGEYVNLSTNLLFKKELPKPENNSVIEIIESFPILTGDGKYRRIAYMVMDWAEVKEKE